MAPRSPWLLVMLLACGTATAGDAAPRLEDARNALLLQQPEQAMTIWRELARTGVADAQYLLAVQLLKSGADAEQQAEALHWLSSAAAQHHSRAQFALAQAHEHGRGVPLDLEQAIHWYRKAAARHSQAKRRLAELEQTGPTSLADRNTSGALFSAVRRGETARLAQLLARIPRDQPVDSATDAQGRTLLMQAAELGHADAIRLLLDKGADTQRRDPLGNTPLLLAVRAGQDAAMAALLSRRAAVNERDLQGNTPLLLATRRNNPTQVRLLLQHHADPNITNHAGQSALDVAENNAQQTLAGLLRQAGARRQADRHLPTLSGHLAGTGEDGLTGWPPAIAAAWRGQQDALLAMLDNGYDINGTDDSGHSVLTRAAYRGHHALVQKLLERGARINHQSHDGRTALIHAAAQGREKTTALLLASDADPRVRDHNGSDALALSVAGGHEKDALALLTTSPTLLANHPTILTDALNARMVTLALAVLDAAPRSQQNREGALALALQQQANTVVTRLLQTGVPASAAWQGQTLLEIAVHRRSPTSVQTLLDAGAQPDNWQETPPLALAAGAGHLAITRLLLAADADVNVRDKLRYTPLMRAAEQGHAQLVALLLEHGADKATRNRDGDTAQTLAERAGRSDSAALLAESDGGLWGLLR